LDLMGELETRQKHNLWRQVIRSVHVLRLVTKGRWVKRLSWDSLGHHSIIAGSCKQGKYSTQRAHKLDIFWLRWHAAFIAALIRIFFKANKSCEKVDILSFLTSWLLPISWTLNF
jgi:hypothetical protein